MSARIIIFVNPKVASIWLAVAMQKNLLVEDLKVLHDGWVPARCDSTFNILDQATSGVRITLGSLWMQRPVIVERKYRPEWVFLMREPLSWVASYTALWMRMMKFRFRGGECESGLGHGIRRIGRDLIAQAEALLCVLEHLGCRVAYWRMDHYTTENGFKDLMKSLQLEVRDPLVDFDRRWNGTNPAIKLNPEDWSSDLREELLTFWNACSHLQVGYRQATERMRTVCGGAQHGIKS